MELRTEFLPKFELRQLQRQQSSPFTWIFSKQNKTWNNQSLLVFAVFNNRDTFQPLCCRWKNLEVHCNNDGQRIRQSSFPKNENSKPPDLSFSRLQPTDVEKNSEPRQEFGRFVAREALLDEEYWTAAWLRAEAHWESVCYMRHVDSFKRKYAEQEFYALKRRCYTQDGNSLKCYCLVSVKKEDKNVRRTVLNSVVGTLDLSIRQFVKGETYPGEIKRICSVLASQAPFDAHKYAYIANVCVAKFARRQGIATNMLYLATDVASSAGATKDVPLFDPCIHANVYLARLLCVEAGMKQLFVHVNADNVPAQKLYHKTGFKIVESASSPVAKDQRLLMSMGL